MSDDADELEQAEAEALARALDDRTERAAPPAEALEAAALLRYSGRQGELAPERADAVLAGLLPKVGRPPARRSRVRVLAFGGGLLAAAAALLLLLVRAPSDRLASAPASPPAGQRAQSARLPAPPAALLAAQAGAAQAKDERARARLEAEMRGYRKSLLGALERAYPARVGMLDERGRR